MTDSAPRVVAASGTSAGRPRSVGSDEDRVTALLGGPELAWLRRRVRRRVERGGAATGTLALQDPTTAQRAAIDRLLGRRPSTGSSVTISLDEVDRLLRRARACDGLVKAVEFLDGPIVDVAARQRDEAEAWSRVLDSLADPDAPAWRRTWQDDLATSGLLRRLAGGPAVARDLVANVERVLAAVPVAGVGRARLAARTLHDSHALDDGLPTTTLVLKALQHRYLPPEDRGALPSGPDRRALWAAAGVLLDELSGAALVLGLDAAGDGVVARSLRLHRAAGEPARVTLRALLRHPPDLGHLRGSTVHTCENPAVVAAAADQHGPDCRPLVCTDGQPSAAVQSLLRMLAAAGVELVHHGDFDRGGVAIADLLVRRFGASPWRYDVASYQAAPAGPGLHGKVTAVPWMPDLAAAINARGVAVHEEQVLSSLLPDLAG